MVFQKPLNNFRYIVYYCHTKIKRINKRNCDKSLVTVPYLNKRCSKASFSVLSQIYAKCRKPFSQNFSYYSKLSDFSQPLVHGVPKVASSEISWNFTKIQEVIFVNSFLFLEADYFCHNLFLLLRIWSRNNRFAIQISGLSQPFAFGKTPTIL